MTSRHTAYLYLLIVSIIWGAASPVVKFTLQWFNPWLFLTYRFAISTLIALPYLKVLNIKFPKKSSDQWLILLTGFVSAPLSLFLFFEALDKTTALSGSLITSAGPLFLILGGAIFFHDRITKIEKLGIGIALIGTILTVMGPLILNGHTDTLGKLEGNGLMLLAVITDIIAALMSKEAVKKGINPILVAQTQFVIGLVIFLPLLLVIETPENIMASLQSAPWQGHLGVLFMAIMSGSLAYTIRNKAIKTIEISESALFNYLQPVWGAILAILWLGEPITKSYAYGAVIIFIGVIIAESKKQRTKKYK